MMEIHEVNLLFFTIASNKEAIQKVYSRLFAPKLNLLSINKLQKSLLGFGANLGPPFS